MVKIFVTRQIPEDGLRLLQGRCDLDIWDSQDVIPKDELLRRVEGCDGILCVISDDIDRAVLDAAGPNLKTISTMSVGMLHIDTFECKRRGIAVHNTADVCSDTAAELTTTLLLMAARRCVEGRDAVRKGEWGLWKPMWICGVEINHRTLGILGFGRVGYGVARRLKPFNLKRIIYNDANFNSMGFEIGAEFVDKEILYRESDFLIITCAHTGATHKMINKSVFEQMKQGSILVNTSRGAIVDTNDLVEALRSGKLYAAGLDVTDPQPLPADHPLVQMENCVITPHLGTNSVQARKVMAVDAAENLIHTLLVLPRLESMI